tara:strand:+ start:1844 stop:2164 length:321 start_codon:yes stop_codon:yes gene_type:complete
MPEATDIVTLVETLGFPAFLTIVLIGGIYFMARWMMNILLSKLDTQHAQLMAKSEAQNKMIIKLIDRVRAMDNDLIRLDVMIRLIRDMPPDWERLGKRNPEDARQD